MKSSTPVSTVSSVETTSTSTAVQGGPYTKAQFLNTMEGSRSVKNSKEVEQLLRDYPAALELYRTGKYKVKVKYEADIERVILVEKRSSKSTTSNGTKSNDVQPNTQPHSNGLIDSEKKKDEVKIEKDSEKLRNRAQSQELTGSITSGTDYNSATQGVTSSVPVTSNPQLKVDQQQTLSKGNEISTPSQPKEQQKQQDKPPKQHKDRRSEPRESPLHGSQTKQKEKRSSRDHRRAIVPYVPNSAPSQFMWQQPQIPQYYYSNPLLQPQQQSSNIYMSTRFPPQPTPVYQQPYYYGQTPLPAIAYQNSSAYPMTSRSKTITSRTNSTINSVQKYPTPSRPKNKPPADTTVAPSFPTYYSNQQQYIPPQSMYPTQVPYQMPTQWPTVAYQQPGPMFNTNNTYPIDNRRMSKNRAQSVDTRSRVQPLIDYYNQQQQPPQAPVVNERHHYHHHHHHRSHPNNGPVNTVAAPVETAKDQNISTNQTASAAVYNGNNYERLTIRQLNDIFVQNDASGRLPYSTVPNILQRFGIALTEGDLSSAANDLAYNTSEPISARRLVHVLIKLGKISKSTNAQQQNASPAMLPEDREVTDIMTHSRLTGTTSTHIHSAIQPNQWY